MKALNDFLRPEFLNRVDEIICFNKLTEENFRAIAEIMLQELKRALHERGVELIWEDALLDYLTKKSYSITYGARNLRRTIQKEIEDRIAERIIDSFEVPISRIALTADENSVVLNVNEC